MGAQWKLIDLDAACAIGDEPVGHKSSSAYVPPEAVDVDPVTGSARVRSVVAVASGKAHYELLTAHPSFDVWSLGCILYQMVTPDVRQLFQGGRDDSLPDDPTEEEVKAALDLADTRELLLHKTTSLRYGWLNTVRFVDEAAQDFSWIQFSYEPFATQVVKNNCLQNDRDR